MKVQSDTFSEKNIPGALWLVLTVPLEVQTDPLLSVGIVTFIANT